MNCIKNPFILGILATALTYIYSYWDREQKIKKNPRVNKRPISLITSLIVGVIVWFLANGYFSGIVKPTVEHIKVDYDIPIVQSEVFHEIGHNGITLPDTDVFIDIVPF